MRYFDDREVAAIRAGLRLLKTWIEDHGGDDSMAPEVIADMEEGTIEDDVSGGFEFRPLRLSEIDDLCAEINQ